MKAETNRKDVYRKALCLLIPAAGLAFLLWYIKNATCDVVYSDYIGAASEVKPVHLKNPADNTQNMLTIDPKYTWGTWVAGEWDVKAGLVSELTGKNYNYPSMSKQYRMSTNKRVFFGPVGKLLLIGGGCGERLESSGNG